MPFAYGIARLEIVKDDMYPTGYCFMEVKLTTDFAVWLDSLKDLMARARIQARIARLANGNPGQHRHLVGGISEMKIDVGAGYRVYYTQRDSTVIILLCGGNKSTQNADIRRAQGMVKEL
jgi:putative addiction module killer protein